MISNLGDLLWMVAAAICLFPACPDGSRPRGRELLLAGGAFSLLFCLHEMVLLHDRYVKCQGARSGLHRPCRGDPAAYLHLVLRPAEPCS